MTLALCSRFKHGTTENDLSSAVQKTANDKHLEDINDPARKQQKQKLVKKNKEKKKKNIHFPEKGHGCKQSSSLAALLYPSVCVCVSYNNLSGGS